MAKQVRSRTTTAEKIEVLCRIYKSAVRSGDEPLRRATAVELKNYGVSVADVMAAGESAAGGAQC